jgi:hypothetical protein
MDHLSDRSRANRLFESLFVYVLAFVVCFDSLNVFGLLSAGQLVVNAVKMLNLALLILYLMFHYRSVERKDYLLALGLLPFFWIYVADSSNPVLTPFKIISRFGPSIAFLLLPLPLKLRVGKLWLNFFVLSLIPGLIIHFLKLAVGLELPVLELTNVIGEKYSSHFLLYFFNEWNYIRFCAIYDEPGVVGTFALLFIIFWHEGTAGWKKLTLWLAGISTLSFYFLASIPLFLLYRLLRAKRFIVVGLIVVSGITLAANFDNILQSLLQREEKSQVYEDIIFHTVLTRLSVDEKSDEGLSLNTNRLNSDDYSFEKFTREKPRTILLGNFLAMGSKEFGDLTGSGLGQEMFLYENGLLLYLWAWVFIVMLCTLPARNKPGLVAASFFFTALCFYQRSFLYRADFLVILYIGILMMNASQREHVVAFLRPGKRRGMGTRAV